MNLGNSNKQIILPSAQSLIAVVSPPNKPSITPLSMFERVNPAQTAKKERNNAVKNAQSAHVYMSYWIWVDRMGDFC